jgi:ubiquinone/menaquinone biosynthesis C-methylase UbiE
MAERYRGRVSVTDEYVLGTHDEEVARLGLQHRVWRAQAHAAWQRAGFTEGQQVLDVGCGPGFASLDLARLVGPGGRVTAVDRSRRFLSVLSQAVRSEGLDQIAVVESNLDGAPVPGGAFDGAWARWVFAFVNRPRALLSQIADRLRPGGAIAIHEYFDYASWRTAPPSDELNEFVRAVMDSWRRSGGEPDIALQLPRWLEESGFTIEHMTPIVEVVSPVDPKWDWLAAFVESGRKRLTSLGDLATDRSDAIGAAMRRWPGAIPPVRMMTPAVLEIVARKETPPQPR